MTNAVTDNDRIRLAEATGMRLRLPWPPTVNNYLQPVRTMKCRCCGNVQKLPPPFLSKRAREYRQRIAEIIDHRLGDARLAMHLDLFRPMRRGDIDNNLKPLLDALEHAQLFNDDEQVDDLRIVKRHTVPGGAVEAIIEEI